MAKKPRDWRRDETDKVYILYGYPDEANAPVLCTADSLDEARRDRRKMFPDAVIYEYDSVNGELRNGRIVT